MKIIQVVIGGARVWFGVQNNDTVATFHLPAVSVEIGSRALLMTEGELCKKIATI